MLPCKMNLRKTEDGNYELENFEDESSKENSDACTCFLSIINNFEDVLAEQERGR